MTLDLLGRTALVTGASGDLGRSIAITLAEAGADVALHFHSRPERLSAVTERIAAFGRRSCMVAGDVGDRASVQAMVAQVTKTLAAPDIVVANAVSQIPWISVVDQDPERFADQFRSCVMQAVHLAQATVPAMRANGGGRFIGISTECIGQMLPNQAAYVAGKRGMDGVLKILAREEGRHGITVNQVAPGWLAVADGRDAAVKDDDYIAKHSWMGRRATAQDVADCVAFLASPRARSITGAWIPVSCGSILPAV